MRTQAYGGFGYSTPSTFVGKLNGRVQHFSLEQGAHTAAGEEIVDENGNPVDASQIVYPTYDPMLGLTAAKGVPAHYTAVVHRDELGDLVPEPALPVAYGDEEDDEPTDSSILTTRAERQYAHVREALKSFSESEKEALINEGDGGTRASHLLNLEGTHYQQLPGPEDDPEWLW